MPTPAKVQRRQGTQDEFPFASLDFPERTTLHITEVAERWGVSKEHIYSLIDEGAIVALDITGHTNKSSRQHLRIPIESYRDATLRRLVNVADVPSPLAGLPPQTLLQLHRELTNHLERRGYLK